MNLITDSEELTGAEISLSVSTGVSRSKANAPTERSDYSRLEVLTLWVLIAVLVVLSCGAFYVLWSKASGGW
jgi:hypothetical protein